MDLQMENNERHNRAEDEDNLPIQREEVLEQNVVNEDNFANLSRSVFSNTIILEKIIKELDLATLKNFRKVNSFCFSESHSFWMKRAWVHLKNGRIWLDRSLPFRMRRPANDRSLQEFSTFFQQSLDFRNGTLIPVQNLSITLTIIPFCTPEWDTFFTVCGPHIKSLEIEISGLEPQSELSNDEKHFFNRAAMLTENVETLHLKLTNDPQKCSIQATTSILNALFPSGFPLTHLRCLEFASRQKIEACILMKFPNLKELVLRDIDDSHNRITFDLLVSKFAWFKSVSVSRNRRVLALKSLDTIGVPTTDLEELMKINFPLEHLALRLSSLVSEIDLANLLDQCRNTLNSLKLLRCKARSCPPFWRLPLNSSLVHLTVLELWGNMMTNLNFLNSLPSLTKLKVEYYCFECPYFSGFTYHRWDEANIFKEDMVENSSIWWQPQNFNLVNLQEFVTDCKMSVGSWDRLTRWMPNLRVLEARIPNDTVLLDVCDRLVKLEKLRIRFGSEINDDGLLSEPVTDVYDNITFSRGITKLTHLRTFEMEVECGQARLTDVSADLGFLSLNHLGCLKLGFTGNLITERMEAILRDRIGHFEMYRTCRNVTGGGERIKKCCKWADFKRDWGTE